MKSAVLMARLNDMRNPLREKMIDALMQHAKGQIKKHQMNVEIFLNSPGGIGEHTDIMESIEKEIGLIAHYHEQLEIIDKYIV